MLQELLTGLRDLRVALVKGWLAFGLLAGSWYLTQRPAPALSCTPVLPPHPVPPACEEVPAPWRPSGWRDMTEFVQSIWDALGQTEKFLVANVLAAGGGFAFNALIAAVDRGFQWANVWVRRHAWEAMKGIRPGLLWIAPKASLPPMQEQMKSEPPSRAPIGPAFGRAGALSVLTFFGASIALFIGLYLVCGIAFFFSVLEGIAAIWRYWVYANNPVPARFNDRATAIAASIAPKVDSLQRAERIAAVLVEAMDSDHRLRSARTDPKAVASVAHDWVWRESGLARSRTTLIGDGEGIRRSVDRSDALNSEVLLRRGTSQAFLWFGGAASLTGYAFSDQMAGTGDQLIVTSFFFAAWILNNAARSTERELRGTLIEDLLAAPDPNHSRDRLRSLLRATCAPELPYPSVPTAPAAGVRKLPREEGTTT